MGSSRKTFAEIVAETLLDELRPMKMANMFKTRNIHEKVLYFSPFVGMMGGKAVSTAKLEKPAQWFKDRENPVYTLNGKVHAICSEEPKGAIMIVDPQHYERCPEDKVYGDIDSFEMDAGMMALSGREFARIECRKTCGKCAK